MQKSCGDNISCIILVEREINLLQSSSKFKKLYFLNISDFNFEYSETRISLILMQIAEIDLIVWPVSSPLNLSMRMIVENVASFWNKFEFANEICGEIATSEILFIYIEKDQIFLLF